MGYRFVLDRLPIVEIVWEGTISDREFEAYLAELSAVFEANELCVFVYESSRASAPPLKQRRRQADWMRDHVAVIRKKSLGTAFVIASPLVRGALSAILWIEPMATDHLVTGSRADALAWAERKLSARGARIASSA